MEAICGLSSGTDKDFYGKDSRPLTVALLSLPGEQVKRGISQLLCYLYLVTSKMGDLTVALLSLPGQQVKRGNVGGP